MDSYESSKTPTKGLFLAALLVAAVVGIFLKGEERLKTIASLSPYHLMSTKRIINGSDPVTAFILESNPQWEGYIYDRYVIESGGDTQSASGDIQVHYRPAGDKSKFPAVFEKAKKWETFTLENGEDNNWFFGCFGNYMFIDQGCCPEPRGLAVYDLNTGKKVFTDSYSRPVSLTTGVLSYWEDTGEKATPADCPEYEKLISKGGGPPGIDQKVLLNLAAMKVQKTGEKRCAFRQ